MERSVIRGRGSRRGVCGGIISKSSYPLRRFVDLHPSAGPPDSSALHPGYIP